MAKDLEQALSAIVGAGQVFAGGDIDERYKTDLTKKYSTEPAYVVRPVSTEQVAAIVKLAAGAGIPITPLSGRTGVVGGGVAPNGGIVLSLERMNSIVEIDTASMTMTVEAGCVLQTVQEAAEAEGGFLPLDLGARGSAMIGGVIATNAGGNRVVRWGMMRDMVIGLEAVLADGTVVSSLTKMLKDNAGYNWKHLLIGSEGTLAIITRAVLRLRPLPTSSQTAIVAVDSFEDVITVLRRLEAGLSGRLSSFELMWESFYKCITEANLPQRPRPLPSGSPFYALVEALGSNAEDDAAQFQRELEKVMETGLITDAVIASSEREREGLWAVREEMELGLAGCRPFYAFDVSMALGVMPAFSVAAEKNLRQVYPNASVMFYGHAGDGNLHAIVSVGEAGKEVQTAVDTAIFDAVRDVGGSIAAEHGIGQSRAPFLAWTRSAEELALMKVLKTALDPQNILNPGRIIDVK
ncbi:MAG: FAD/FMN-containing dehydrogenase [Paracoccaceae bacterium]|jgi:FAD/FMN-containing dehydrogenase